VALAPVFPHRRNEKAKVLRGNVGQRVRPVFEHALVDALGLAQVGAA
jgi:porphobilinogen deaminase